jgi:hypothetical protein
MDRDIFSIISSLASILWILSVVQQGMHRHYAFEAVFLAAAF